jgi:EmrB/QacA subfamily drug resistance transporter
VKGEEGLSRRSPQGRTTLAMVILGSGIALLDGTVVNIALKAIGTDLDASLVELQWVTNGYLLSLASLILVGGALGDRWGRKRIYLIGVAGFAVSSALCALARSPEQLVAFRVVQGVAAALLTPGGLALIQGLFRQRDRAPVIGTWAGMTGIAAAAGPFVGGFLIEHAGWRWIFAINLPLCAIVLLLGTRVPESRDLEDTDRFDARGALSGVTMLAAATYALTSWRTLSTPVLVAWVVVAVVALVAFLASERRHGAMMPLEMFAVPVFSAANLMTFLVYGALGAVSFFVVLQLQVSAGWSALGAGLSFLPLTLAMLVLSARFAALSTRIGPRWPMGVGPLVCACGVLLLTGISGPTSYWTGVLPGMAVFALGLSSLVSPLTTAVLAAAPDRHAGIASGVNNAVARTGSLLAVAALPAAVGLQGDEYTNPVLMTAGFQRAMWLSATLLAIGGVVSWWGLRRTTPQDALVEGTP